MCKVGYHYYSRSHPLPIKYFPLPSQSRDSKRFCFPSRGIPVTRGIPEKMSASNTHTHTHTHIHTYTHRAANTHTVNTQPEQWEAIHAAASGSSWGFGALLKGTSVGVSKVERALDVHSLHLQFLPARDSNSQPFNYESDSLTIIGHDLPTLCSIIHIYVFI